MNRRARALSLIFLLLGGYPARPALGAAVRARVEICSTIPAGPLEALCDSIRSSGLEVRAVRAGGITWLEVAAGPRSDPDRAWRALRRAARSAGVKVRFRPVAADRTEAIAASTTATEPSRAARAPVRPVATATPPHRARPTIAGLLPPTEPREPAGLQWLSGANRRGPPA